jgi:hypothetical protein
MLPCRVRVPFNVSFVTDPMPARARFASLEGGQTIPSCMAHGAWRNKRLAHLACLASMTTMWEQVLDLSHSAKTTTSLLRERD